MAKPKYTPDPVPDPNSYSDWKEWARAMSAWARMDADRQEDWWPVPLDDRVKELEQRNPLLTGTWPIVDYGTFFIDASAASPVCEVSGWAATGVTYNYTGDGNQVHDIWVRPDGLRLFAVFPPPTAQSKILAYSMAPAFDLSSLTLIPANFYSFTGQIANLDGVHGMVFSSDGTKMIISVNRTIANGDELRSYTLSSAWDLTSLSFAGSKTIGTEFSGNEFPMGIDVTADGTQVFVSVVNSSSGASGQPGRMLKYSLSSGWDVTTATKAEDRAYTLAEWDSDGTVGIRWNSNGSKYHMTGSAGGSCDFVEHTAATNYSLIGSTKTYCFDAPSISYVVSVVFNDDVKTFFAVDPLAGLIREFDCGN